MLCNPVFRSLNRPLTILGAERKLFFFALVMGACVFNLLDSLTGALGMFFALYFFARWATRNRPANSPLPPELRQSPHTVRSHEIRACQLSGGSAVFKLGQITKEYDEAAALSTQINLFGFVDDEDFSDQERRSGNDSWHRRCRLRMPRPQHH